MLNVSNELTPLQKRYAALVACYEKHGLIWAERRAELDLPPRQILGVTIMRDGKPHWYVKLLRKGKYVITLTAVDELEALDGTQKG